MLRGLVKALLLPPSSLFVLAAVGLVTRRRRPRLGAALVGFAGGALVVLSMPLVASALMAPLQRIPALPADGPLPDAEAIVVLAADHDRPGPEFGGNTLGAMSLVRLRYAAALARRTGLPLLVSGGLPRESTPPAAVLMRDVLEREFGSPVRFVEAASEDTWANAARSAEILGRAGIERVFLVTHAWHMPRARRSFEAHGVEVVPAPTGFVRAPTPQPGSFSPSAPALETSHLALHEMLGLVVYAFRRP